MSYKIQNSIRLLAIILILTITGCEEPQNYSFTEVSPAQVKQLLDKDGVILLDVREPEEYVYCHIPGSILLSVKNIPERYRELPKDKEIIVYCKSGCGRSPKVCEMLAQVGFTQVKNMTGGIDAWCESKGRVEGSFQTKEGIGKVPKCELGRGCES